MEEEKRKLIRDELIKCSNCGLCLGSCPEYQSTKNETFSPRAIINMTRHQLTHNLSLSFKEGCKEGCKCIRNTNFEKICPAGINLVNVFSLIEIK